MTQYYVRTAALNPEGTRELVRFTCSGNDIAYVFYRRPAMHEPRQISERGWDTGTMLMTRPEQLGATVRAMLRRRRADNRAQLEIQGLSDRLRRRER